LSPQPAQKATGGHLAAPFTAIHLSPSEVRTEIRL
jgi:hypothetical protein